MRSCDLVVERMCYLDFLGHDQTIKHDQNYVYTFNNAKNSPGPQVVHYLLFQHESWILRRSVMAGQAGAVCSYCTYP